MLTESFQCKVFNVKAKSQDLVDNIIKGSLTLAFYTMPGCSLNLLLI